VISGVTKTTDYIGGIEYNNSTTTIGFIQTEEGKAVPNGTTDYDYNYYLGDNPGNTRVTFGTKTGAAVVYPPNQARVCGACPARVRTRAPLTGSHYACAFLLCTV
jgi:hypothetical protein